MRLDIPIKVGFSSPISNYLYTVVLDPSENSFLEDNYITIEKILGNYNNYLYIIDNARKKLVEMYSYENVCLYWYNMFANLNLTDMETC